VDLVEAAVVVDPAARYWSGDLGAAYVDRLAQGQTGSHRDGDAVAKVNPSRTSVLIGCERVPCRGARGR
jgi:hypothetical protein